MRGRRPGVGDRQLLTGASRDVLGRGVTDRRAGGGAGICWPRMSCLQGNRSERITCDRLGGGGLGAAAHFERCAGEVGGFWELLSGCVFA